MESLAGMLHAEVCIVVAVVVVVVVVFKFQIFVGKRLQNCVFILLRSIRKLSSIGT
jgi:hypothetical protein